MRRRRLPAWSRALLVLALVGAAVGAGVVALTDSGPSAFPRRIASSLAGPWPSASPPGSDDPVPPPAVAPISDPSVPLFSDDWFDDSGYSLVRSFEGPIDDPTSLEQF